MTEAVQIAIVGGLTTAVPLLFGQWLTAHKQMRKQDDIADAQADIAGKAAVKVAEVHTLVNSKMTAALEEIEILKARVQGLGGNPNVPEKGD